MQKITRAITRTVAHVLAADRNGLQEVEVFVPRCDERAVSKALAAYNPALKLIEVTGYNTVTSKYAMDIDTFIANATIISE